MIPLLLLILAAPLGASTISTDAPGEMDPAMLIINGGVIGGGNYTQTVQLHPRWNLVSWHLDIDDPEPEGLTIQEIVENVECGEPIDPDVYFPQNTGRDYGIYWYTSQNLWYPVENNDWRLKHDYYFNIAQPLTWTKFFNRLEFPVDQDSIKFIPSEAWDVDPGRPGGRMSGARPKRL
jgi:hypothetical protein